MGGQGFALALEQRRLLAVTRVNEGWRQKEVAMFLGVHPGTISAWVRAVRQAGGFHALRAKAKSGRPCKLSRRQERMVLGWVAKPPTHFGFANDLWTTRRLAPLTAQRWNLRFNAKHLAAWLRAREHSPQRPEQGALPSRPSKLRQSVLPSMAKCWPPAASIRLLSQRKKHLCSS